MIEQSGRKRGRPMSNDLAGQKFGMLDVLDRFPTEDGKVWWRCECECGSMCRVQSFDLISGKVRSCGCYRRKRQREIYKLRKKIGRILGP